jgi:DNA polymerase-3 subunit beta
MRVLCSQALLSKELDTVRQLKCPVLGLVASQDSLKLVASDGRTQIEAILDANTSKPGTLGIQSDLFASFVKSMPQGEVTVDANEKNKTVVSGGKFVCRLAGLADPGFGAQQWDTLETLTCNADQLAGLIGSVQHALPTFSSAYIPMSIQLKIAPDGMYAAATDAKVLAMAHVGTSPVDATPIQFSPNSTEILVRALKDYHETVTVERGERAVKFTLGKRTITTALVDGKYPNLAAAVPKAFTAEALANKDNVLAAIKRATTVCTDKTKNVKVELAEGKIRFRASSEVGDAEDDVEAIVQADESHSLPSHFTLGFEYISKALASMGKTEMVSIKPGTGRSVLLTPVGSPYNAIAVIATIEEKS